MADEPDLPGVTRLPSVGLRLDLTDLDGEALCVVRRNDGVVELHPARGDALHLDEDTSHTLAAFLSGRYVMPPELATRIHDAIGGVRFDWLHLGDGAYAVGKSIAELAVRSRTDATIVAVLRGSVPMVAPDPTMPLAAGDELVYASRDASVDAFEDYLLEGR